MRIEKYPHPYRSWLTVSNDPDVTDIETWHAWNDFLFKELKLPWANALFLFSFNKNLPRQVSLSGYPEIAGQPIDGLHTWGDFVHAAEVGFSRDYAEKGLELLEQHGIRPKVWIDHSRFTGNMLHNNTWGSIPSYKDSAGLEYTVFEYSLDLVEKAGIRYIWDGNLTQIVGQDRDHSVMDRFQDSPPLKRVLQTARAMARSPFQKQGRNSAKGGNSAYFRHEFPDGRVFYCFRRFGRWRDADILGISRIISKQNIDRLIHNRGVMVAYTHLGKINQEAKGPGIIPAETQDCFRYVRRKMNEGLLKFSSLSHLLDYLVLRDHADIDGYRVRFKSDGIRFHSLDLGQLVGFDFTLCGVEKPEKVSVSVDGADVPFKLTDNGQGLVTLSFSA